MARRDDQHQQLHYATVMPSNASRTNGNDANGSPAARRRTTELERAKALYVDFGDAFEEETTNLDYFGGQPSTNDCYEPANFYLQSVEMISEVKNTNLFPFNRRYASRENSRPSTPSDPPLHRPHPTPPLLLPSAHETHLSNGLAATDFHTDFSNLNLLPSTSTDESAAPFTPDAIRLKIKKNDYLDAARLASQYKLILPQYFLVKYLGRKACAQLWGAKAVRAPIDDMVHGARQLPSMNDMPTLEACINPRGLTLTHRQSPTRSKHHARALSPERHQHGLIPLEHISYVMHDVKYSKVSACIVLRQSKSAPSAEQVTINETVTECYAFLFQSKDHAHRFALSLAEAFNAQKSATKTAKAAHDDKRDGRSPRRRSKHRSAHQPHHHERTRTKYDDTYLRDSEV